MQINYTWLQEFIQGGKDVHETAEWLTSCGLEVEDVTTFYPVQGGLDGVVVGEIMTCEAHPGADRLKVTTVNVGNSVLPIVCGAPNAAAGQKVWVALPGTTLYPKGKDPLTLKKVNIRGVPSEGMICAEDELGIGDSHDGIVVLPVEAEPGTPASVYLGWKTDHIIHIGLTANRGDAASHLGVARDLVWRSMAKVSANLEKPALPEYASSWNIDIQSEGCIRYSGILLENIKVGPSPEWLKWRLSSIGLSPINNVVDITNYVLHGWGQPIHAFDADALTEGKIEVRMAKVGEKFTTLDKAERTLSGIELLISSNDVPVAQAGVFGGLYSGVTEKTTRIFLESACFHPSWIRRSAKAQGLSTDASFRYERGTDPEITVWALYKVIALLQEICGAVPASAIVDNYPNPVSPHAMGYRPSSFGKLIGMELSSETQKEILESLDIEVQVLGEDQWEVHVPARKWDVTRPADLMEEIIRIYGINEVKEPEYTLLSRPALGTDAAWDFRMNMSKRLAHRGFQEVFNNSLSNPAWMLNTEETSWVKLINPLSQPLSAMRDSLIPGLMETWRYNRNRQQQRHAYYEFGRVYSWLKGEERPDEIEKLGLLLAGNRVSRTWYTDEKTFDWAWFWDEIQSWPFINNRATLQEIEHPWLIQGFQLLLDGKVLGWAGVLNKNALSLFDAEGRILVAELDFEELRHAGSHIPKKFNPPSRFPEVHRDLSLILSEKVSWKELKEAVTESGVEGLSRLEVFDVYQDAKIGEGKKSYAISLTLTADLQTLTDEEVDKIMGRIRRHLEDKLGALVRDN